MTPHRRQVASLLAVVAGLFMLEGKALAAAAKIGNTQHAYLRGGPGVDSPPIATLNEGDPVETLDTSGVWTKVQTPGGKVGYVYHSYVMIGEEAPTPVPMEPVASSPEPPPAAPSPPPAGGISTELAELKAQIADLKQKVGERVDQEAGAGALAPTAVPGIGSSPGIDPSSPPSVGSLAVGLVGFILGCFTGAALTRRRGRSQRSRLRF